MTITIDCRMIDSSGVGVYLRGCLPWLLKSPHHFLLLGGRGKLRPLAAGSGNAAVIDCDIKPFSPRELLFFPKAVLQKINSSDCFYSPFFNIPGGIKVPVYTTIHDIIFPDMPELVSKAGLAARMFFYRRAFSRSRRIFTVSEFSKTRIEHYSRGKVPVTVSYSAAQPWILERKKNAIEIEKEKTIVFTGNIKKHKGLDCLLDAFIMAKNEGLPHKLVIIGSKDNFRTRDREFLKKLDACPADSVVFTGFVSDKQLGAYLASAALLVQPSRYEGFGLPPLEAMMLGTRALVSDIPVFKEIYDGFPVTFFSAGDSEDLKQKLLTLLLNQPYPAAERAGYGCSYKELQSGFNTFLTTPEGRGIKPLRTNKNPERIILSMAQESKYTFEKTTEIILKELSS